MSYVHVTLLLLENSQMHVYFITEDIKSQSIFSKKIKILPKISI